MVRRVKLLGEGSFGCVFLMREKKRGGKLVCVKQIRREHNASNPSCLPTGHVKSHSVEVELMKKLRHPNLIRLLHSFVTPAPHRQQHIVMEYCSGGDLRAYLRRNQTANEPNRKNQRLSEDKVWCWFVQLALGLHHMHQQRVLHRDVKTANVFLSNIGFLVLGDLGIARTLVNGDMAATVIGTPLYMAPEVLDGKDYSFSSDVWALGCVLYELCTGKSPFVGTNMPHLMNKICHGSYAPIAKDEQLARSRLPALVAAMLNTRPERRPSVDQILRDPNARVHLRFFYVDRIHAVTMWGITEEERRMLEKQMVALGVDVAIGSSVSVADGIVAKVNGDAAVGVCSSVAACSRHQVCQERQNENLERRQRSVRELERQDQLGFAMEKLQQMHVQNIVVAPHINAIDRAAESKDGGRRCNVPPVVQGGERREPLTSDEWKDPVRVASVVPRHHLLRGRSNSVPNELTFSGIPRAGVPLTAQAKTFAARRPICRDMRVLWKEEAVKAAERY
ncbi:hypothetical protein BBJ28_00016875 [Nothophytophthora sp. Chile5]|nr:hypothetical protein BBJ28_00016875 [Nothophytophthora sp. Chile5]